MDVDLTGKVALVTCAPINPSSCQSDFDRQVFELLAGGVSLGQEFLRQ